MARTSPDVAAFLDNMPEGRRKELETVRTVVRRNLPKGYAEVVLGNYLAYVVPLSLYPDTYNKQPLMYVAIAPQKNYLSLHLVAAYMNDVLQKELREGFAAAKKKLDMGKACIRFNAADDLALDVIGKVVSRVPMERYIATAKAARAR